METFDQEVIMNNILHSFSKFGREPNSIDLVRGPFKVYKYGKINLHVFANFQV